MDDNAYKKIAETLIFLKNIDSYVQINKGDFSNAWSLEGWYVPLKKIFKEPIYIIFNNSKEYKIDRDIKSIEGSYFAILNLYDIDSSLENFIGNLDKNSKFIIEVLEKLIIGFKIGDKQKDNKGVEDIKNYDLPYGYVREDDGHGRSRISVDKDEANMVRKIFLLYNKYKSMKKVALEISSSGFESRVGKRADFSTVSGILHDERYLDKSLPQLIVPLSLFNATQETLRRNIKGNAVIKY